MFPAATPAEAAPPTSQWSIEILDELRIVLLECVLVLGVLPKESGLHLNALADAVNTAHRDAQQAHRAASLLRQGAALHSWLDRCERRHPHTVLLEHEEAVRRGAVPVTAAESQAIRIERRIWHSAARHAAAAASGPGCVAQLEPDGTRCGAQALHRDAESFGVHCYRHANENERNVDWQVEAELYERERELVSGYQRAFGREVAAAWMQRRRQSPRWFDRTR